MKERKIKNIKMHRISFWFQFQDNSSYSFAYELQEDRKLPLSLMLSDETVRWLKPLEI